MLRFAAVSGSLIDRGVLRGDDSLKQGLRLQAFLQGVTEVAALHPASALRRN